MASSKVKEITEEVIVEQEKLAVRNAPASRRRTKQVLPELAQVVLVAELPAEPVSQVHKKTKLTKVKKPKLVRDSFTIPEAEYIQLAALKQRCLDAGLAVKKSELLRAGLQALVSMPDEYLVKQFDSIEKLKTGRPSKAG
ncbi:hypothetical protein [Iodobacter sp. BJB302]|uniref:hypothetical protein n=2 Tax=unclassified Iodobacter TaxID=235634 RepID=UPI000C0E535E|nr:hypothetical protein [Iodobacter sp. BJB302]PHV00533.1 hypothetical protein CSQ88_16785 [Iodobacter sp. BJB302]